MPAARHNFRMAYDALLARIAERLKALGISERKACLNAGLKVDAVRTIRNGYAPKIETLQKLAVALGVPASYLTDVAAQTPPTGIPASVPMARVYVRGAVQAGVWRDAIEWEPAEWYEITVPADGRFGNAERFGLVVRGTSMNRLYPEGTILICVRFSDLDRMPVSGQRVICLRRSSTGEYEATVKEYEVDERGRHVLWPRSTDPEFQQPIVLDEQHIKIGSTEAGLVGTVNAGRIFDDGGEPDLLLSALVIGAYRPEP